MWNDVLKKIDTNKTPQALISCWASNAQQIHLVSEGVNLVYRFEQAGLGYYARLTHASLRSETELKAALAYQRHLFSHGVPVCELLISSNQLWVESFQQGDEVFTAHVCREVPGTPIHFDYKNIALYGHWGKVLGQLHRAAKNYDQGQHEYTSWDSSLGELHEYAPHESQVLQDVLDEVTLFFKARKQTSENFGLTHGDHREGNVLTDGEQVHIIDFDLPSKNWFMEDLARPFFHPIIHDEENWLDKMNAYLDGYFSVMSEDSVDLSAFSKQIQLKALEIYLWTKNNWSGDVAPGGLDTKNWLQCIYQKLINNDWIQKLPQELV
ncbi:MAG: phosphotransferase [Gammaproteobacteria bacterium]|nr:phosphotransferase [Gammaproteobacteria bacterium]